MSVPLDYIAGFFDGDGSFGVGIRIDNKETGYENRQGIEVSVGIGNNYIEILEKIQKTLNMGSLQISGYGRDGNPEYAFQITNRKDCEKFINLIGDRMDVKKKQGRIFRQILDLIKNNKQNHKIPEKVMLKVIDLNIELVRLKSRKGGSFIFKLNKLENLRQKFLKLRGGKNNS